MTNQHTKHSLPGTLAAILLAALLSFSCLAQNSRAQTRAADGLLALNSIAPQGNTTVRGQVLDELNASIPGAKVTLTGADGRERTATSAVTGDFSIAGVPPGAYTVTVEFNGFQPFREENIKVPLAQGPLQVQMRIAAVTEVIETRANNEGVSTEPDQNMSATVLGEEFIKNLPDNEDDLRDFLNALAGPSAQAGNGQGADIIVDGFSGGRLPPREAIMQIRVNQNPYSPEYSGQGFGRIEIITRPGRDQWRGSGGWGYRNSGLDARNAFALTRPDLLLNRYNFNFGGPVIKKRMSMNVFAERSTTDGSTVTFAKTLDGDFVANVPSETARHFIGTRADYLLNDKNTLNMSYNYSRSNSVNQEFAARFGGGFGGGPGGGGPGGGGGFGGGGFGGGGGGSNTLLPDRASNRESNSHNIRLGETWIVNSKMINEARFEFDRDFSDQIALFRGVAINVQDSFSGGGSTCCPNLSLQTGYEFQNYLTYTTKGAKHTLKGGVQFENDVYRDVSGSNFNGTYTFTSLDQYRLAVEAYNAFRQNPANPLGGSLQFTVNQGTQELDYSMFRGSWFINDDWRVRPSLTLSLGLRHEFQNRLDDKVNFAPRFGLAWSPFKSRKTTIRMGGGLFYERLRNSQYENALRFNGQFQQSFIVRNALFNPDNPIQANQSRLQAQTQTLRPLDAGLNAPYDIQGSATLEQQLPKNIVATVTYSQARGIHQFRTRNINAPFPDPNNPGTLTRPNLNVGFINQIESSAISDSKRLLFVFRRSAGKLNMFGNYTLSWIRSNGEGSPADNYNLALEYGRSAADARHSFFMGGFYNMPWGFRISTFINARTGTPFNITTGRDDNQDGAINDRPLGLRRNANLTPDFYAQSFFERTFICVPGTTARREGDQTVCFNSRSERSPQVTLRSFLTQAYPNGVKAQGPGSFNVSLNLSKTIGFKKAASQSAQSGLAGGRGGEGGGRGGRGGGPGGGGPRGGGGPVMMGGPGGPGGGGAEGYRYNLTLQIGASNVFNRVNFGQYSGTLGSAFFGLPSSANAARQLDFNVRFSF